MLRTPYKPEKHNMMRLFLKVWVVCILMGFAGCTSDSKSEDEPSDGDLDHLPGSVPWRNTDAPLETVDDTDVDRQESDTSGESEPEPDDEDFTEETDDQGEEDHPVQSCNFGYDFQYDRKVATITPPEDYPFVRSDSPGAVVYPEPAPEGYWTRKARSGERTDLVMPSSTDDMPRFERGFEWESRTRCYELTDGARYLEEEEAFDLYADILLSMFQWPIDIQAEQRTVLGLRGAYPGTFVWHGNRPNRFNDTLVLLWMDDVGVKHVREFAGHTDTGPVNFGADSSSSLYPNRRYQYINGWHRGYNALQIHEWNYMVRNDTNHNGHWDSDRNDWLPPDGDDYYRIGSAHNIHLAAVDAPLFSTPVDYTSAGCQVIPGLANWTEFIINAWTAEDDSVDYFLVDVRDIPPEVWNPCNEPDGSHACPYRIDSLPVTLYGDTSLSSQNQFGSYNCAMSINESGPEVVYVLPMEASGMLVAEIFVEDEELCDPDIHLLEGDDPNACRARGHQSFEVEVWPGRYFIVVDTWVDDSGQAYPGPYRLELDLLETGDMK